MRRARAYITKNSRMGPKHWKGPVYEQQRRIRPFSQCPGRARLSRMYYAADIILGGNLRAPRSYLAERLRMRSLVS